MPAGPQIIMSLVLAVNFRFVGSWLRIRALEAVVIGLQPFGPLEVNFEELLPDSLLWFPWFIVVVVVLGVFRVGVWRRRSLQVNEEKFFS